MSHALLLLAGLALGQEPPPSVDFARDIWPIFKASCLKCHGPEGRPKGQFRLDTRALAFRGGVSGKVIRPGQSSQSLLYKLLLESDDEARMPQKSPRLAAAQIELVRRWIDEGAPWPGEAAEEGRIHWSLRPLAVPPLPHPRREGWARSPIDLFVLSRLEERGLAPSPEADRRTWLRRVTYDLAGLPPSPEEELDFEKDASADAYERVVDRLLESPRYGERWARHWLDVVHYADTHGHDQDRPRPWAWPYRDYVIRAFNQDTPYARFVQEQLAGDVLFPDDPGALVATGFIAAGPWDESSQMHIMADTVDKKIAQNLDRDDMLTATLSSFMSLTIQCARCHNHKFDPVSQAEYYALQSCFAGVDRANRPFDDDPALNRRRQELLRKKTELAVQDPALLKTYLDPAAQDRVAAWLRDHAALPGLWTVLEPETCLSKEGSTLVKQPDGSVLSTGARPEKDIYTITARTELGGITAVRLEVLTVDDHPYKGPGRQDNGNFHLSEFRVLAAPASGGEAHPLHLQNPTADFNQAGWTIAQAIDEKPETAWGIYPEVGKAHWAVFELPSPLKGEGGLVLTFILEQLHGRHHLIARPRLSVTTQARPSGRETLPDSIARIAALPADRRSPEEIMKLGAWVAEREIDQELRLLPKPRQVYAAASDFVPQAKFTPARRPRPVFLLKRGDVAQPQEPACPGGLGCLPGLPAAFPVADPGVEGLRRAALARWVSDSRNVLTWRSIVNRVWHYHFGRGLADSPNDLGRMGAPPTHPELIDWLALWFRDHGGSLKQLNRMIVTSAAYRQGSRHDPQAAKIDGGNLYLWRMNRLRLDAEEVRDSILKLSGRLDLKIGGPSVMQFHFEDPNPGVTPKVDYARFDVDHPDSGRRSIYRWIYRTLPDPFMETLDCPDASQLTGARNVSVTPLQAMAVLNDRFVVRQSEHLASRLSPAGELPRQIEEAYRLIFQRAPTRLEEASVREYASRHGLANACRMLLNSNEFMFLD